MRPTASSTQLAGVIDPEEKRRIVGETFIRVFEAEADKIGDGRLHHPGHDVSGRHRERARRRGAPSKIKTHHNVGGLPKELTFELVEPLRYLFKDEVRQVGLALGLPDEMVYRQPFPGPGLAIRIIGEVTKERVEAFAGGGLDRHGRDQDRRSCTTTSGSRSPCSPTRASSG